MGLGVAHTHTIHTPYRIPHTTSHYTTYHHTPTSHTTYHTPPPHTLLHTTHQAELRDKQTAIQQGLEYTAKLEGMVRDAQAVNSKMNKEVNVMQDKVRIVCKRTCVLCCVHLRAHQHAYTPTWFLSLSLSLLHNLTPHTLSLPLSHTPSHPLTLKTPQVHKFHRELEEQLQINAQLLAASSQRQLDIQAKETELTNAKVCR